MPTVHRFDHIGITVADLEAATAFFVGLGLEVEARTIGESFDTDDAKQRIAAFVEASRRRAQTRG